MSLTESVLIIDVVVNQAVAKMNEVHQNLKALGTPIRVDDCIIRLALGRQFGHTTWVNERLKSDRDVVLVSGRRTGKDDRRVKVYDPTMNPSRYIGLKLDPSFYIIEADEIRLPKDEDAYLRHMEVRFACGAMKPRPIVIIG